MPEETKFNFEESLKKLDEIVNKIESETLPLEETLKLYEEGKRLTKALEDALKAAEQKIEEQTK